MAEKITIRLSGNAIDISVDGKLPLPPPVKQLLEAELWYEYKKLLRGQDAYDYGGQRRPLRIEKRLMYSYDKYERMVCGIGLLSRVKNLLMAKGYEVVLQDINPPHPRPNRFKEDWDNVVQNFTFRARQDEALIAVSSNARGIINAPTGFGKSFMFQAIGLLYPKANINIITKRKELVNATRIHLSSVLPSIGQVGGGMNQYGRITVATADSMHKLDAASCDILIGEEVHELATPSYSAELAKFRSCRMYGFTATPTGRLDNADMKIESLFGQQIFYMSYPEAVELGLVVPIKVRWVDVRSDTNPCADLVDVPRNRWGIWRNEFRNQAIADVAREFGDDEQVLIMVTTFDHAVHLRQFLPEFTLCYAERGGDDDDSFERFVKNGMLPADEPVMTTERREQLRRDFEAGTVKKVIATDIWSTGVNFHKLSVLIRGDARSSPIMDAQIPGRVCRLDKTGNKPFGLVIDFLDQFDSGFQDAARRRRKNYESKGWEQEMPSYAQRRLLG